MAAHSHAVSTILLLLPVVKCSLAVRRVTQAFVEVLASNETFSAPMDATYALLDIEPGSVTTLESYLQVSVDCLLPPFAYLTCRLGKRRWRHTQASRGVGHVSAQRRFPCMPVRRMFWRHALLSFMWICMCRSTVIACQRGICMSTIVSRAE